MKWMSWRVLYVNSAKYVLSVLCAIAISWRRAFRGNIGETLICWKRLWHGRFKEKGYVGGGRVDVNRDIYNTVARCHIDFLWAQWNTWEFDAQQTACMCRHRHSGAWNYGIPINVILSRFCWAYIHIYNINTFRDETIKIYFSFPDIKRIPFLYGKTQDYRKTVIFDTRPKSINPCYRKLISYGEDMSIKTLIKPFWEHLTKLSISACRIVVNFILTIIAL